MKSSEKRLMVWIRVMLRFLLSKPNPVWASEQTYEELKARSYDRAALLGYLHQKVFTRVRQNEAKWLHVDAGRADLVPLIFLALATANSVMRRKLARRKKEQQ
jgi:hypothetical protein